MNILFNLSKGPAGLPAALFLRAAPALRFSLPHPQNRTVQENILICAYPPALHPLGQPSVARPTGLPALRFPTGEFRMEPSPERNQRPHPPPHRDRPRIRLDQPIQHLQQRGLPRPVMPNQPQAFPPAKFKRHILDGEELARTETVRGVECRGSRGACRRCNG